MKSRLSDEGESMKILDTGKSRKRSESERELREFEKWLKSQVSNTTPPTYDDLKGLFDGCGRITVSPDDIKNMVDLLRKTMNP